jgi:hypothetical protein
MIILIITLTPEIDYDQKAMNLPPVTSAVFLIAKNFLVKRGHLGGTSEISATPSGIKHELYVCIIKFHILGHSYKHGHLSRKHFQVKLE